MATRFFILTLTTLLLTLTLTLTLAPTPTAGKTDANDVVLDFKGDPLELDSEYYIIPVGQNIGGGIRWTARSADRHCPLYAEQSAISSDLGQAVKFIPKDPAQAQILAQSEVMIDSGSSTCGQGRGFWKLQVNDGRYEVMAADRSDDPAASFRLAKVPSPLPIYEIKNCLNCDDPNEFGVMAPLAVMKDRAVAFPAQCDESSRCLEVVFVKKTAVTEYEATYLLEVSKFYR